MNSPLNEVADRLHKQKNSNYWSWISPAIELLRPWKILMKVSYSQNYKSVISDKITCWEGEQFPLRVCKHNVVAEMFPASAAGCSPPQPKKKHFILNRALIFIVIAVLNIHLLYILSNSESEKIRKSTGNFLRYGPVSTKQGQNPCLRWLFLLYFVSIWNLKYGLKLKICRHFIVKAF